jgi:biopolymer transport protein ExbD
MRRNLNLIPLIDFFLLLLLFALLSVQFGSLQGGGEDIRALEVRLPQGLGDRAEGRVVVELTRKGSLRLMGKPIEKGALEKEVARVLEEVGGPVLLLADREVAHQEVVGVLESLRRAGAKEVELGLLLVNKNAR